jgi:uncharacterized membrane protein
MLVAVLDALTNTLAVLTGIFVPYFMQLTFNNQKIFVTLLMYVD